MAARYEVRALRWAWVGFVCLLVSSGWACTSSGTREPELPAANTKQRRAATRADQSKAGPAPEASDGELYAWENETRSPRPGEDDPELEALWSQCDQTDRALHRVARRMAARRARGLSKFELPQIVFALRAEGSPYVWARGWTVEGLSLAPEDTRQRMKRWLDSFDREGSLRCGVGTARAPDGTQIVSAVAVDTLADLMPISTSARLGQWVKLEAELLVPLREAQVVLLGPRGLPDIRSATIQGRTVSQRFALDHAGTWLVQVVATVTSGPRPVVEAMVHVDAAPPRSFRSRPVPGENSGRPGEDDQSQLEHMANAARASEGLGHLQRDARLDAIAQAHADSMRDTGHLAHDVGKGGPRARIEAAGLPIRAAGENVAHADDARRAHRALWASPSHRGTLLHARFNSIGVGVARDPDGTVWVCQVFAEL